MNAEIICVGTEIILGDILNTHSQFLSQELASMGINVYYHTSVGDNDSRFTGMLKQAIDRSDIVFLTGGLGPTTDDITKEVACELLGVECTFNQEVADRIQGFFTKSARPATQNNFKQAMVPNGSIILQNDWGTAPGFIVEKDNKTVVLLPGPPRELRPMFKERVVPYLKTLTNEVIVSKNVRVFGIGESMLENDIEEIVTTSFNPTVALYAKTGEVLIRVTAKSDCEEKAVVLIDEMIDKLKDRLGDLVYGVDVDSLHETLVDILKEKKLTVATAESCTGGLLASMLTEISGASGIFGMGVVTYANEVKTKLLGVKEETLNAVGAVSEEVATEMALGLEERSGADYSVSITGIAGPTGGTEEKPVGTVYIAVAHKGEVTCTRFNFARRNTERDYIRALACLNAMNMIRLAIQSNESHYSVIPVAL